MDLTDALGFGGSEVVALVGGGGKTTTMYRLCLEAVGRGRKAIASGTARFTLPATVKAPLLIDSDEQKLVADARRRLSEGMPWLILASGRGSKGRLLPISYEAAASLGEAREVGLVALEADGSALRPFKAPAGHEPVIPVATTLVVPVVGADIFGKRLDDEHVHRPELISKLSGSPLGAAITPEIVARVLAHPQGGCKGVPPGARVIVIINKVETLADSTPARETAERLLREPAIESVVFTNVRRDNPVAEIFTR